jgi:hypothetical protein
MRNSLSCGLSGPGKTFLVHLRKYEIMTIRFVTKIKPAIITPSRKYPAIQERNRAQSRPANEMRYRNTRVRNCIMGGSQNRIR